MQTKFFGSKLNTVLLLILIVLMVIAIKIMLRNERVYAPFLVKNETVNYEKSIPKTEVSQTDVTKEQNTITNSETYTYRNHGVELELPNGFNPQEIVGETGPTISISLPNDTYMVYITNATWWENYNIKDQADLLRNEKIGGTTFDVYRYKNQTNEFYYFRQGNVAYIFDQKSVSYMKTFKFVGWN